MPKYKIKLDSQNRMTIPKYIAQTIAIENEVYMSPNTVTVLIQKKGIPLEEIIRSTELLVQMLKHELELGKLEDNSEKKQVTAEA